MNLASHILPLQVRKFMSVCLLAVLIALSLSCGSNNNDLGQNQAVSDCGGFSPGAESSRQGLEADADASGEVVTDCSETLDWEFDADKSTVTFMHRNNRLNCCGEHSVQVLEGDTAGTFELAETDESVNGARCGCVCMFDFKVELPDVKGVISVKLTLWEEQEESDPGRVTVWEGNIDLAMGSGSELIRVREGDNCW